MPMGIGIGLSITRGEGVGVPSWLPLAEDAAQPLLYADYTNSRFWFAGRQYGDETALNTAWGGTKSGITRQTTTPIITGSELVSNGDFPSVTTGWTAFNSATLAIVSGKLQITGNAGNVPGASQQVSTVWGKAYALSASLDRTGGGLDIQAKASTNSLLNSAALTLGSSANAILAALGYFGGVQPAQYVGARINLNPANGTTLVDDISVKEAVPIAGWNTAAGWTQVSGLITGTTPAAASGDKVLWQADDGTERSRLRLVWKNDTTLHFISTNNNADVADVNLGAVAVSTAFAVAFAHTSGSTKAALNGNTATSVAGQNPTGACYLRIGRSFTGETWDGAIASVSVWAQSQSAAAVETLSGSSVVAWGDSLTNGTGATNTATTAYPPVAATLFTPDRAVSNQGVGGETSTQIAARQAAANRSLNTRIAWIWVGRNDVANGGIDTSANVAAMVGRVIGGKYLVGSILPSTSDGNLSSGASLDRLARNAALSATYGARYIDLLTPLQAAGDGGANDNSDIANGWVPRSLRSDAVHLNDAGYAIVAQAFYAATIAQGW